MPFCGKKGHRLSPKQQISFQCLDTLVLRMSLWPSFSVPLTCNSHSDLQGRAEIERLDFHIFFICCSSLLLSASLRLQILPVPWHLLHPQYMNDEL